MTTSADLDSPVPAQAQAQAAPTQRKPLQWIPSLYFAQGLPYFAVALIAGMMYKSLGFSNDQIAAWTGALGFAWVFKPLWSPLLEAVASKKKIVLLFQLCSAVGLGLIAVTIHTPGFFEISMALLAIVAISSATHDIACDGLYIASLSPKQQAIYAGWLGAFFNASKLFSLGGLLILAGWLEREVGAKLAWSAIFAILGATMLLLALYHAWALPDTRKAGAVDDLAHPPIADVLITFFQKPGIWLAIAFIILFRLGEGQITSIAPLFLREARNLGGLGLTTDQVGAAYGLAGTITFIVGSILGGYFASWLGLKRAILPLIIAMNLPNLVFYYLASAQPQDLGIITFALGVEMFGFGFGFVGLMLFMMQVVSVGKYQTAHYALATGVMQLGLTVSRMISGEIQVALGYQHFFLWVLLATIPVIVLSFFLPLQDKTDSQG